MNYSIIVYIIGWILKAEAALLVLSALTAIIYKETAIWSFVITILICFGIGMLLTWKKPKNKIFYVKEGFVTAAFSWIVLSCMGAVPFLISGSITYPVVELFQTDAGFTTIRASILAAVDSLPRSIIVE